MKPIKLYYLEIVLLLTNLPMEINSDNGLWLMVKGLIGQDNWHSPNSDVFASLNIIYNTRWNS